MAVPKAPPSNLDNDELMRDVWHAYPNPSSLLRELFERFDGYGPIVRVEPDEEKDFENEQKDDLIDKVRDDMKEETIACPHCSGKMRINIDDFIDRDAIKTE